MVTCAIAECGMRSNRDHVNGVRFFCVPKVITNQCEWTREISERRRALWITRIGRRDLKEEKIKVYTRVCSRHFVSGSPAAVHDETSPDWAPSLHLGHEEGCTTVSGHCHRNVKKKAKKNAKKAKIAGAKGKDKTKAKLKENTKANLKEKIKAKAKEKTNAMLKEKSAKETESTAVNTTADTIVSPNTKGNPTVTTIVDPNTNTISMTVVTIVPTATAQVSEPNYQIENSQVHSVSNENISINMCYTNGQPIVEPNSNSSKGNIEARQQGCLMGDENLFLGGPSLTKINMTTDVEVEAVSKEYQQL